MTTSAAGTYSTSTLRHKDDFDLMLVILLLLVMKNDEILRERVCSMMK